jgi:hypothetical protein
MIRLKTRIRGSTDLKQLFVYQTQTTDAGVNELQDALPKLQVFQ